MFNLHKLLDNIIQWVNSIGQPKVVDHTNGHEVITAIKVKKDKPVAVTNHSYTTTSSTVGTKAQAPKPSAVSDKYGLASTSSWVSEYSTEIPEDLKDLLGSASNVAPVDINEIYGDSERIKTAIQIKTAIRAASAPPTKKSNKKTK